MAAKFLEELGPLQRAVLETVWDLGKATVSEVRERLAGSKTPAYTTVLSIMQKLEKAGWLNHRAEGRVYLYTPACTREQATRSSLGGFLRSVFRGDPMALFQNLLEDQDLSDAEIERLRKMIARRRARR